MPDVWMPGCPHDPGDAGVARGIEVQTVTLHRTIGRWPGDYSVGKHRDHNSGTFQFLIGQAPGEWVQFYPVDSFCSHAAGSNEVGPGVEISGQNGEDLTEWQIDVLGRVMRWLRDEWGIAPTFTDGDPRVWADQEGPLGFITHRHVAYPPNPRFHHYDYITDDEFARAMGDDMPLTLAEFDAIFNGVEDRMRKVIADPNGPVVALANQLYASPDGVTADIKSRLSKVEGELVALREAIEAE